MNEHEFRELSAGHAMHSLSPDDERAFAAALAAHPEWRHIVDGDQGTAALLGETAAEVAPPPAIREALLAAIAVPTDEAEVRERTAVRAHVEPVVPTAVGARRARRSRRLRAGWFALAACAAVLLAVAITPVVRNSLTPAEPLDPVAAVIEQISASSDAVVSEADAPGGGHGTLYWSPSVGQAVFVADDMPELAADRDFEAWIVRGDEPISLGVMGVDDSGDVAMIPEGFVAGDVIAITVEDRGGSPDGKPTSDPILVVSAA